MSSRLIGSSLNLHEKEVCIAHTSAKTKRYKMYRYMEKIFRFLTKFIQEKMEWVGGLQDITAMEFFFFGPFANSLFDMSVVIL